MKRVFSKAELDVLKQFRQGATITDKTESILYRFAAIGFVRLGFNWDTMEETAKLTELGLMHL